MTKQISRRGFLKLSGATAAAAAALYLETEFAFLQPAPGIDNPLDEYPTRDWEDVYRDQYAYDDSFTFVCAPNDTHNCRLRAFMRNGIMIRTEQNYDSGRISDPQGNSSTVHWNPRGCLKGFTFQRRLHGPYRLKHPMIRTGWKRWAEDGFPPLDAAARTEYKFDSRGTDTLERIEWDEAYAAITNGMVEIATRYSGGEGAAVLAEEGYQPEMIDAMKGAGTRTFKFRGGMGLTGVLGKYGLYRCANALALLDVHVRGVPESQALGGRRWSNYTWHGDQAPGHPFVHGLQASDVDFNELRHAKLHVQVGKNLVENKMPDSHFFQEVIERGGKIVSLAPEYSPPATKSDYWIPVRPGLGDTAIFLGIAKWMMDNDRYDAPFVKRFTDFPLLIREDTLERLDPADVFAAYEKRLSQNGASFALHGLTVDQYDQLHDFVIVDANTGELTALSRDEVGDRLNERGIDPELNFRDTVTLRDGSEVEVMTTWEAYRQHLADYDMDTVAEISNSPKDLIERLAEDMATIKPMAIHVGEGINHWFHATLHNRATYLPVMLTGNIGIPGGGCHTWAGNYKAALFQATPESGPGFKGWIAEDPFSPNLDPTSDGRDIVVKSAAKDEEPAYWDHGDQALIVETDEGRRNFTGQTHMPTPTKVMWFNNVNIINNAKWVYGVVKHVLPRIDLIIAQDIEMTASAEYSDFVLPANSWAELQSREITASCSNPFLQIWGGEGDNLSPMYDTRDDLQIQGEMMAALSDRIGDERLRDYYRFILDGRPEIYLQRLLDASGPTRGYSAADLADGKYGEPGVALMQFRTYPRIPFWEQVNDSVPFFTETGRLDSYCDIPDAIEFGENFIVHREGPEATPYLPNVIVSSNPLIRPNDFGISRDDIDADRRTIRNIRLPWNEVKDTTNPLWEEGFNFYFLTPKTRHSVHSSWAVTDWNVLFASNFADPYRSDKRLPHVGDQQILMNPDDARGLDLKEGDYVYIDANPRDRPYIGATEDDPFFKVARLMARVKYNPAYPPGVTMVKHGGFMATEKTVAAHESRADGRAMSADTGYQSNFRYGSHQSVTRDWAMPMHQTDTLFHKAKVATGFLFGGEADNHAINTVPKETLVRITKAADGGTDGVPWRPGTTGLSPGAENDDMRAYIAGGYIDVSGGSA